MTMKSPPLSTISLLVLLAAIGACRGSNSATPADARSTDTADSGDHATGWVFDGGGGEYFTPAALGDSHVYTGNWDGRLYALDFDGRVAWTHDTGGRIDSAPTVTVDGDVVVGSWSGEVVEVSASGDAQWSRDLGAPIDHSVSLGPRGTRYAATLEGTVYALHDDGSTRWRHELKVEPSTALAIDGRSLPPRMFVGGADGKVYCLAGPSIAGRVQLRGAPTGHIAIDGEGRAVVTTAKGRAYRITPECEISRKVNPIYPPLTGAVVGPGDTAYVGGIGYKERFFRLKSDFTVGWKAQTGTGGVFVTAPAIAKTGDLWGSARGLIRATPEGEVHRADATPLLHSPVWTDRAVYAPTEHGTFAKIGREMPELADGPWPTLHGDFRRTGSVD